VLASGGGERDGRHNKDAESAWVRVRFCRIIVDGVHAPARRAPLSGASVAKRSRLLAADAAVLFTAAVVIAVTGGSPRPFGPFGVSVRRPATCVSS